MVEPIGEDRALIRASELAEFSFCERAWWLGNVKKISPGNRAALIRGRNLHTRHEHRVQNVARWRKASFFLLGLGSLILVVAFWLSFA